MGQSQENMQAMEQTAYELHSGYLEEKQPDADPGFH